MRIRQVLIVEDDQGIRRLLAQVLEREGWHVTAVPTGEEALRHARRHSVEVVLIDLHLPDMDGVVLIEQLLDLDDTLTTIVMTGFGTVERAVQAMQAGAVDFLRKPFDPKAVVAAVTRASEIRRSRDGGTAEAVAARETDRPATGLVGDSEAMRALVELVQKVADCDSTVLIMGESGTGKEVIARTLHTYSRRRGPLVPVNCGAIPEALLESELFGHERGAFSGAHQARAGRFEMAHGGTLFLDEIGELPLPLQVKLLRALQERSFERVGGTRSIKVDVRIIAATNVDLETAVREGRFRKDLFYRLNVIPVLVPALRQRRTDIPLLVRHFVAGLNARKGGEILGIETVAMERLVQYDWPGNVRELENLVERLVVIKRGGTISVDDLPDSLRPAASLSESRMPVPASLSQEGIDLMMELEQYENQLILEALTQANGITSKAARLLRLNRTTLVEKLKRKKLDAKLVAGQDRSVPLPIAYLVDEPSMI